MGHDEMTTASGCCFAAIVLAIGVPGSGRCEQQARESSSYRVPLIVTDVTSFGLIIAGAARNDARLGFVGLAGYVLSGPVVHWANGEGARGMGSLALRVMIPAAGLLIGASFPRTGCSGCGESLGLGPAVPGMLVGAAAGAVVSSAIDIGFLA